MHELKHLYAEAKYGDGVERKCTLRYITIGHYSYDI